MWEHRILRYRTVEHRILEQFNIRTLEHRLLEQTLEHRTQYNRT